MLIIIIIFILLILYFHSGIYYSRGMVEYAIYNNISQQGLKWKQEDFKQSIINEIFELIEAIKQYQLFDIILELFDVFHSVIKYIIISIMPQYIYCNIILWSIVYFFVLPCSIKLGNRFKKYNCIRNHKNKNNRDHNCNYLKK